MEIPGLSNNTTENLKQKKIISWAPVVYDIQILPIAYIMMISLVIILGIR